MGVLVALTLPGLVLLLLAVAAVDQLLLHVRGRGVLRHRQAANGQVSSTGFELLHAALAPGKGFELRQRHTEELVRDDEDDGAPPCGEVDLGAGVARLRLPRTD